MGTIINQHRKAKQANLQDFKHIERKLDIIAIPTSICSSLIIILSIIMNEFFDLLPENLTITRKKENSKGGRCLIEELPTKDGNTQIYSCLLCLARGVKRQRLSGGNPILFLFLAFCSCLVINKLFSLCFFVFFVFNQCLCQVEPLGRLGESLDILLLKKQKLQRSRELLPFLFGKCYLVNSL